MTPQNPSNEQRLLRNARREGLVIMLVWALALIWSSGTGTEHRLSSPVQMIEGRWQVVGGWWIERSSTAPPTSSS